MSAKDPKSKDASPARSPQKSPEPNKSPSPERANTKELEGVEAGEDAKVEEAPKEPLDPAQRKIVEELIGRLSNAASKINQANENTVTNVSKRVKKQKKYENDINRMQDEYDKYREKDPKEFEKKVKHEVDYSLLHVQEKRMRAETKIQELLGVIENKNVLIRRLDKETRDLKRDNAALRERLEAYEGGGPLPSKLKDASANIRS